MNHLFFRNKITATLVILNIAVYFLEYFIIPNGIDRLAMLMMSPSITDRLLGYFIAGFSHLGFTHIFINLIFLYFFAPILERCMSSLAFLNYYILMVMTSGILTDIFSSSLAIGASGALYALIGTVYFLKRKQFKVQFVDRRRLEMLILINLAFSAITPDISFIGHLSGFICGIIFGVCYYEYQKHRAH